METELRPVTIEAALLAYQALWHGQVAVILGRPMENSDVQAAINITWPAAARRPP